MFPWRIVSCANIGSDQILSGSLGIKISELVLPNWGKLGVEKMSCGYSTLKTCLESKQLSRRQEQEIILREFYLLGWSGNCLFNVTPAVVE